MDVCTKCSKQFLSEIHIWDRDSENWRKEQSLQIWTSKYNVTTHWFKKYHCIYCIYHPIQIKKFYPSSKYPPTQFVFILIIKNRFRKQLRRKKSDTIYTKLKKNMVYHFSIMAFICKVIIPALVRVIILFF